MPINPLGQFIIDDRDRPKVTKKFYRKASPDRIRRDLVTIKYEGRSNTCPKCFTARSATGDCAC